MPSLVVASRSPGIGIVAAVGLVLVVAAACGRSGSAHPDDHAAQRPPTSVGQRAAFGQPSTLRPARPPRGRRPLPRPSDWRVSSRPSMASPSRARWPPPRRSSGSPATVPTPGPDRPGRRTDRQTRSPLDGSPCGVAVGPDGRIWVALLSIGTVVAVDPATAKVVATIDGLGTQPVGPEGRLSDRSGWSTGRKRELLRIDPIDRDSRRPRRHRPERLRAGNRPAAPSGWRTMSTGPFVGSIRRR